MTLLIGLAPEQISHRMTPNDQMSAASLHGFLCSCSGAAHMNVAASAVASPRCPRNWPSPTSATKAVLCASSRMFGLFRSKCAMRLECRKDKPPAMSRAIERPLQFHVMMTSMTRILMATW